MNKVFISGFMAILLHMLMGTAYANGVSVFDNLFFSAVGFIATFSVCYWQLVLIEI